MSDTTDDLDFWGSQLLMQSQVEPLRDKMRQYLSESECTAELEEVRSQTSGGAEMADLVDDEREERF